MTESQENYPANQERIAKQKALFLEQLKKTPIVQIASEKTGVSRTTIYRWRKDDPLFEEEVVKAIDIGTSLVNDLAESKLVKQIQDENFNAIRFWLTTHHKSYSNKLKVTFDRTPDELSDEEIADIDRALANLNLKQLNSYGNEQSE